MQILNIGPFELIIVLLIMFLLLGPKEMILTAQRIGKWIRGFVRSPIWREIMGYSQEIRELPQKLMDDTGLKEAIAEVQTTTKEATSELNTTVNEAVQAARVPEAENLRIETNSAAVPAAAVSKPAKKSGEQQSLPSPGPIMVEEQSQPVEGPVLPEEAKEEAVDASLEQLIMPVSLEEQVMAAGVEKKARRKSTRPTVENQTETEPASAPKPRTRKPKQTKADEALSEGAPYAETVSPTEKFPVVEPVSTKRKTVRKPRSTVSDVIENLPASKESAGENHIVVADGIQPSGIVEVTAIQHSTQDPLPPDLISEESVRPERSDPLTVGASKPKRRQKKTPSVNEPAVHQSDTNNRDGTGTEESKIRARKPRRSSAITPNNGSELTITSNGSEIHPVNESENSSQNT